MAASGGELGVRFSGANAHARYDPIQIFLALVNVSKWQGKEVKNRTILSSTSQNLTSDTEQRRKHRRKSFHSIAHVQTHRRPRIINASKPGSCQEAAARIPQELPYPLPAYHAISNPAIPKPVIIISHPSTSQPCSCLRVCQQAWSESGIRKVCFVRTDRKV